MTRTRHHTQRTSGAGTIAFAKLLRRRMTTPESRLWEQLRRKAMSHFRFRRQHPIGPWIADFYCDELGLVIELDGDSHDRRGQQQNDSLRTLAMTRHGLTVVRFRNEQIMEDLTGVLAEIHEVMRGLITTPPPTTE